MMEKILCAAFAAVSTLNTIAYAGPLQVQTFNPGTEAIFPVTSTLVYGSTDALLVDAQFQKKYAKKVVKMIKESGKKLKYVFISHSDPDYYFGLEEVVKAFPDAAVLSTAQTAYLIGASKDAKLELWKDRLGADAPESLHVPEAIQEKQIVIDGVPVEIRQNPHDSMHSYLWIPSLKTVLGGISVAAGSHLWMADTAGAHGINLWLRQIADMQSLRPERVIPGHCVQCGQSPAALGFVKDYLEKYKTALAVHKDSTGIITAMEKRYPDLPGKDSLVLGAQALTGERPWHTASPYPPIGGNAEVRFGDIRFLLHFKDDKTMSFQGLSGAFKGVTDTVRYTAVEVGPKIFMVYWHEPEVGANVVHVQNWNNGTVYTNISGKDNSFTNLKGTIILRESAFAIQ